MKKRLSNNSTADLIALNWRTRELLLNNLNKPTIFLENKLFELENENKMSNNLMYLSNSLVRLASEAK